MKCSLHIKMIFRLTALVFFSTIASAKTAPVDFITAQCLNIQPINIINSKGLDNTLHHFEQQNLTINNINDNINYFLHNKLNHDDKASLINCQIRLSDIWNQFLLNDSTQQFLLQLKGSSHRSYRQLATQIENSILHQLTETQKAKLRTYESVFRSEFLALKPRLIIHDINCKLDPSLQEKQEDELEITIARYLLRQPNNSCRKAVWETYYQRDMLKRPLLEVVDLRQHQATSKGFDDFSQLKLANNYLNSPELVEQFLTHFSDSLDIAPWSIGRELQAISEQNFKPISTHSLLTESFTKFQKLGLKFEEINAELYRVWLHNRLLGDITINLSNKHTKIYSKTIRYPIVGYQFGQASLSSPTELKSFRKVDNFVQRLSKIVAAFSDASPNYLTSKSLNNNDYSKISDKWLAEYLVDQLEIKGLGSYPRLLLANQYLEQLEILRAKVALNLYRKNHLQSDVDALFQAHFGSALSSNVSFPLSFNGIIEQGPMYYQKLWQKKVGGYLYRQSKSQQNNNLFFDILVVNENRFSFQQQVEKILKIDISPSELIDDVYLSFETH
ncbi:M3 family metallopeptidase [Parashewanella spongiae]|nr:M3 family metallopeptidase [Parashewanella spongiae]MCL1080133.1 M3 family metallopeptidase [Parashewanella spongiae]